MPVLAVSGDRRFIKYKDEDIEAAYIAGKKVYGKNLWRFTSSGNNDYGTTSVEAMDGFTVASNLSQHYKLTVTGITSNIWSRLFQSLYPSATTTSYNTSKKYSFSVMIKPSLNRIRIYVYVGAVGGGFNQVNFILDLVPNAWNLVTFENRDAASPDAVTNKSLVGLRYLQADHMGVNMIGQTVEIKEVKLEEGELSPYSVHSTLL